MTEPLSTRRDGDTWDLASGVGATATAVATSRALAHRLRVIDDPWAEPLVRAVGNDHFLGLLDSPAAQADQHRLTLGMAVRTRYFDEFMLAAADAGIRQMVILATGLDTRGYRLNWPAGTTVFDLDQPAVVEFKATTLTALGVRPTATVRTIGVDLRDDWPAALADNGFDSTTPTAWIAEGLLMYLPAEAQDRLFDHITALSAAGSRVATEFVPNMAAFTDPGDDGGSRWRRMGFKDDLAGLVYPGERTNVIEYLQRLGWSVTPSPVDGLFETYGIEQPTETDDEMDERFAGFQYISATLNRC
ncbi:MAG TPA: class I SAM-dependent methyltransferase [Mycobacterium sp.]|nr:class I SAM-dependent methyltransferase [Mycobacterium sp.]HPZ96235.1 class I SAM-dependent methyltransferase [Mycobacterium sp.]HQE15925.1 class I SAM-dependent methyltransferase [Mycobacterium sp.]